MVVTNLEKIRQEYHSKGWAVQVPIPAGRKAPPFKEMTGNIAEVTPERVEEVWRGQSKNSNLALRMQSSCEEFDVIAVDIDTYGDKNGYASILEAEKRVGVKFPFEDTPMSTRRDPNVMSGQFFFRVTKGKQWEANPYASVEVIQLGHRYSMVYPSVVKDQQYRWYLNGEHTDIPAIDDLPWLDEAWQKELIKSHSVTTKQKPQHEISQLDGDDKNNAAFAWLQENIDHYDSDVVAPMMRKVVGDKYKEDLIANGHDTMVSAVRALIRFGTEGHRGLKKALNTALQLFVTEMVQSNRRAQNVAIQEFFRAVSGEVEAVISEIEKGSLRLKKDISEKSEAVAALFASENQVVSLVQEGEKGLEKATEPGEDTLDLDAYPNSDRGHAQMLADYFGKGILATDMNGGFEYVQLQENGRYKFFSKDDMIHNVFSVVSDRIRQVGKDLKDYAFGKSDGEFAEALGVADKDPSAILKVADSIEKRACKTESAVASRNILAQLHGIRDNTAKYTDFDASENLIGIKGGYTLDLDKLVQGDSKKALRPSHPSDMLTRDTGVELEFGYTSEGFNRWLDKFLPDLGKREYVQKVFGASLMSGNPHKKLFVLAGPTNTGKTTLIEAFTAALGDYAGATASDKLLNYNESAPSPDMIRNLTKRAVTMSELGNGSSINADQLKRATGNDTISARNLFSSNVISAKPQFTPYVSTNTVPNIKGVDKATKERLVVVPFDQSHAAGIVPFEDDIIKNPDNLKAVLAWIVEGYVRLIKEGLDDQPETVQQASASFSHQTSDISAFIDDKFEEVDPLEDGIGVMEDQLAKAYAEWSGQMRLSDRERLSILKLRKQIRNLGFEVRRTSTSVNGRKKDTYRYIGIQLK